MHGALRVSLEDILMVLSIGFSVIDGVLFWGRGHHQGCCIIRCIFKKEYCIFFGLSFLFVFILKGIFIRWLCVL
ncbi:hypothetical protein BDV26DRAFT_259182 [Aspergillus bertholletiae]|uniref:Uncharacterized protein n=1 Tax=Aspergillus bertholletiae TaxID=1226010 RepID=A0A5N7BCX9_9EURO|nr:hypothetical protein BDV26DRAFT_259182 [Aspergillus bertholletiae]